MTSKRIKRCFSSSKRLCISYRFAKIACLVCLGLSSGCIPIINSSSLQTKTPEIPRPTPTIFFQGEATISTDNGSREYLSAIDFDTGTTVTSNDLTADITILASGGTMLFYSILKIHNTSGMYLGDAVFGIKDCITNIAEFTHGSIPEIFPGAKFCIKTNNNNIALVNIQATQLEMDDLIVTFAFSVRSLP